MRDTGNEPNINDDDDFQPTGRDTEPSVIDPDSIGANVGARGSDGGDNSHRDGRRDTSGAANYGDGYGPLGKYGKGRFPDGRSRKRNAHGTGSGTGNAPNGEEKVSDGTKRTRRSKAVDPHGIEVLLLGIHAGISSIAERGYSQDERIIPLGQDDARRLSVAIANVARHYPQLETTAKAWDHIQLATVAAGIYGPMFMMLAMRKAEERRNARQVNVMPFNAAPQQDG